VHVAPQGRWCAGFLVERFGVPGLVVVARFGLAGFVVARAGLSGPFAVGRRGRVEPGAAGPAGGRCRSTSVIVPPSRNRSEQRAWKPAKLRTISRLGIPYPQG